MTITLDLTPDIEHRLLVQAQAKGVSLADFVEEIVAQQARQVAPSATERKSLVQVFRESPLVGLEIDWDRDKDPGRDISF